MSTFNTDEVLAMAQQIEHNGAGFYRRASQIVESAGLRDILYELSTWEQTHEDFFRHLREDFFKGKLEAPIFDPEDEVAMYLKAIADGHVFDLRADPLDTITGKETAFDLISYALKLEKDSIIFYLGLKNLVPYKAGRDKVQEIISEEMKHISFLSRELNVLKAP